MLGEGNMGTAGAGDLKWPGKLTENKASYLLSILVQK